MNGIGMLLWVTRSYIRQPMICLIAPIHFQLQQLADAQRQQQTLLRFAGLREERSRDGNGGSNGMVYLMWVENHSSPASSSPYRQANQPGKWRKGECGWFDSSAGQSMFCFVFRPTARPINQQSAVGPHKTHSKPIPPPDSHTMMRNAEERGKEWRNGTNWFTNNLKWFRPLENGFIKNVISKFYFLFQIDTGKCNLKK